MYMPAYYVSVKHNVTHPKFALLGKQCVVTEDAFFSLLEMNGIKLYPSEKSKLAK